MVLLCDCMGVDVVFFFSSRRRHTRWPRDWSSDVCSSDLKESVFYGGAVHRQPFWNQASLHDQFDRRRTLRKRILPDRSLDDLDRGCWMRRIHHQAIIPRSCGAYFPIGGKSVLVQLGPVLAYFQREDQGTAFDGDGVVLPARNTRLHGKLQLHVIGWFPFAVDHEIRGTAYVIERSAIDRNCCLPGPRRNSQLERKCYRMIWVYCQLYAFAKGILSILLDLDSDPFAYDCFNLVGRIGDGSQSAIVGAHP